MSSFALRESSTGRRSSIDRALLAIEREFIRGILWLGLAAFPFLAGAALFTPDASIGLFAALALFGILTALLQLRLDRPRALPVVLVVVVIAAIQLPIQSSQNRAAMMVGVAALGALGGLFVERRHLSKYIGFLTLVWAGQLIWAADQGAGVFQQVDHNELFGMAIQLGIFVILSRALHVLWRVVSGSEKGYRNLFDRAPTSLWEEDYSRVVGRLDELRHRGITDLRAHLAAHPELVEEAFGLVEVTDVNHAAVSLVEAENREQLLGSIDPRTADRATMDSFVDQLEAIWEGRDRLVIEFAGRTFSGRPIDCVLHWSVPASRLGLDFSRVLVSISDVSDLADVQRELAKKNALLNSIANLQSAFIADVEPAVLFGSVLDNLLDLTGSEYGFVGEVRHGDNGAYLQTHALSDVAWDADSAALFSQNTHGGLRFDNLDTLFGAVITTGETVISNNPDDDPRSGGRPGSHPPMDWFLGVPLRHGVELVGVVGIANRPGGYDEAMVASLEPFLTPCANLIVAYRSDRLREEAEEALHRTERRLRLVAENVADLLYTMSDDGTVRFISQSVERLLGYEPADLVDTDLYQLVHPEDRDALRESGRGLKAGASSRPIEHRMQHVDGTWRLMEATAVNMLHDPAVSAWVVNARDVTARKAAEVELHKARDAAQHAAASKAQFLANISHEIRTPMNAILGMTELTLETELSAEQREYLGITKTSVDALLTLVNDLLDFSKMEAGKLELEAIPFSLHDTISDTVRTIAVRAAEKGLKLSVNLDPAVPDAVVGDPGRVRQILFNLLGNALKFTHIGHVNVAVGVDSMSAEGVVIHFVISDTGIGIPEDIQESIFGSFAQADGSTTRKYGGTGLGLSITAELVAMMGGKIWVESEAGKGSKFSFTIVTHDDQRPKKLEKRLQLRGKCALVVDDLAVNRKILKHQLEAQGMTVVGVASGREALELLTAQEQFDVAILDMHMPEMDGVELATKIRVLEDYRSLPLIMLSSMGQRDNADGLFTAVLTKPAKEARLFDALSALFGAASNAKAKSAAADTNLESSHPLRILLAEDNVVN
ncbi:MAG: ATP-binding protein, partial [Acidimicrobiia bacterium]